LCLHPGYLLVNLRQTGEAEEAHSLLRLSFLWPVSQDLFLKTPHFARLCGNLAHRGHVTYHGRGLTVPWGWYVSDVDKENN